TAVHRGVAPYLPNSLGQEGEPVAAEVDEGAFVHVPREVSGPKVRANPASFSDHFSQATLFWASMTAIERAHIIEAFTFELSKCYEQSIRERMLGVLANVDAGLCTAVAAGLGLPAPKGTPATDPVPSPALSQIVTTSGPIAGRVIGVVATDGADLAGITKLRRAVEAQGAVLRLLAPSGGTIKRGRSTQTVDRTFLTTRSIEYDAVVVAAGNPALSDIKLTVLLGELFRHCKVIGAWGDGAKVLTAAGIDTTAPGIILGDTIAKPYTTGLFAALGLHRAWARSKLVMTE
ncbi:catalase-related domain-containing protein, partial [Kribbella sp. CWNU-51]